MVLWIYPNRQKNAQKAQALAAEKETLLDNYLADYPFVTKEDLLARIDSGLAGGETFQNISSSRLQEILKKIGSEDTFKSEGVRQLAQQFQDIFQFFITRTKLFFTRYSKIVSFLRISSIR